jgi:Fe-S cluster assembly protein SufD
VAQFLSDVISDQIGIRELSARLGEPAWLGDARVSAYERFLKLPAPTGRTEGWRRLDFKYDATPLQDRSHSALSKVWPKIEGGSHGVEAVRLHDGIKSHPDLVRLAISKPLPAVSLHKDMALIEAGWQEGVLVHVPDKCDSTEPVRITYCEPPFTRTLIVVGAGARATIVERHTETWSLGLSMTDIIVGEGAEVRFVFAQDAGAATNFFAVQRARLARDSKLITLNFAIGASLSKIDVEVSLDGQGAESDMLGLVFGDENQQFDFHTLQAHRAPDTRSDLLYKTALDGHSHSSYTGVISIGKDAPRSQAYQADRNLLLSEHARAATEPKLEILIDDVARCTHGATIGPVDDEQLFYLRSRGLDPDTAARMIVEGFFQEVFHKVGDERVTADLARSIAPHVGRLASA